MSLEQGDLATGVLVGTVEIVDCSGKPGDYKWHLACRNDSRSLDRRR
jgi:hypothetical protein